MPPKSKPEGKRVGPQGKTKSLPKNAAKDANSSSGILASNILDQDAENQYELELCWCIEQLQSSLQSGKMGEKQSLTATKTLNLLKSNTTPLIGKRQAMRSTFGDYRAKMTEEEKKHGRYVSNFKFSELKSEPRKSLFLKKATNDSSLKDKISEDRTEENDKKTHANNTFVMRKESDVSFKFNFHAPECE